MNKTWLKTGWRPTALLLTVSAFTLTLLAASGMATSAVADELFTVVYEKKIISSDEETVSATLILHVTNVSGQDVNDVVAWVSGMNN
ncbi:MAG: hypothetical protein D3922_11040, partial [Candidatus Electrothrix sp. AR1]|nr:hypothetical protein [Candidatus Electrothrix sp. AR1]